MKSCFPYFFFWISKIIFEEIKSKLLVSSLTLNTCYYYLNLQLHN